MSRLALRGLLGTGRGAGLHSIRPDVEVPLERGALTDHELARDQVADDLGRPVQVGLVRRLHVAFDLAVHLNRGGFDVGLADCLVGDLDLALRLDRALESPEDPRAILNPGKIV